jgi:putative phosphoribosyl transferase
LREDLPMDVSIPAGQVKLEGVLELPPQAKGVVAFSHGSGSGRHSPRNRYVAGELNKAGLGTLLLDLLTFEEDRDRELRFDIALLTARLADAVRFLAEHKATRALPVGLFGASTGAASALLIVGGEDTSVIELNREASEALARCEHKLVLVPGATHLFEEPGTLEQVARLAAGWFARHLAHEAAATSARAG